MKTAAITVVFGLGAGGVFVGGPVIGFLGAIVVIAGVWVLCHQIQNTLGSREIDKYYNPEHSKPELQGYKTLPHRRKKGFFSKPDSRQSAITESGQPSLC